MHIKQKPEVFEHFHVQWTPTQLILDEHGEEHHRMEGFLPVEDFVAELELGLGKLAFDRKDYDTAARRFRLVVDEHPEAAVAPEARYWAGVAVFKANHEPRALEDTAKALHERYPDSEWTRKSSVWMH